MAPYKTRTSQEINLLVEKFAPFVYFHKKENYLISSVDWFFERAKFVQMNGGDPYTLIEDDVFKVNFEDYHNNDLYEEERYRITKDKDEAKYGDLASAKIYVHLLKAAINSDSPYNEGDLEIQYWLFFPFNGVGNFKIAEHEGDWEVVKVIIDSNEEIRWVGMEAHGKWSFHKRKKLKYHEGSNHPIVYVSNMTHAIYKNRGYTPFWDWRNRGKCLRTWEAYEIIACDNDLCETNDCETQPDWLKFRGRWGTTHNYVNTKKSQSPIGPQKHVERWIGTDEYPT